VLALTSADSDVARLIREHDVGVCCAQDDVAAIAGALRDLLDDPSKLERLRGKARRVAVETFSEDAVLEQWRALLSRVLKVPRGEDA
jgi:glycosyltransferase involved in cell wall biosynthesis